MMITNFIHDRFMGGVYNSTYEERFDGGPKCADESTFLFKLAINGVFVSVINSLHLYLIYFSKYYRLYRIFTYVEWGIYG